MCSFMKKSQKISFDNYQPNKISENYTRIWFWKLNQMEISGIYETSLHCLYVSVCIYMMSFTCGNVHVQGYIAWPYETVDKKAFIESEGFDHFSYSWWWESIKILRQLPYTQRPWEVIPRGNILQCRTPQKLSGIFFKNSHRYAENFGFHYGLVFLWRSSVLFTQHILIFAFA